MSELFIYVNGQRPSTQELRDRLHIQTFCHCVACLELVAENQNYWFDVDQPYKILIRPEYFGWVEGPWIGTVPNSYDPVDGRN